jgi:hypothetical protein
VTQHCPKLPPVSAAGRYATARRRARDRFHPRSRRPVRHADPADLGAEVIKIENPVSGDDTRTIGVTVPGGESAFFLSLNRGKQSVAIDLQSEAGR